jgi:hypothetical protein
MFHGYLDRIREWQKWKREIAGIANKFTSRFYEINAISATRSRVIYIRFSSCRDRVRKNRARAAAIRADCALVRVEIESLLKAFVQSMRPNACAIASLLKAFVYRAREDASRHAAMNVRGEKDDNRDSRGASARSGSARADQRERDPREE